MCRSTSPRARRTYSPRASVGDINSSLYEGEVYWADIQDSTFYALHLNDLRMDNVSLISVRTPAPP